MQDRHLDFEAHLEWFDFLGHHMPEAQQEAQRRHAAFVSAALGGLCIEMAILAKDLRSREASYYMLYGATRRLRMLIWSYASVTDVVPPDRIEPLSSDEQYNLSRDLNVIYMHTRGVLDNFAWCFLYEKEPEIVEKLPPVKIALFSKSIRGLTKCPDSGVRSTFTKPGLKSSRKGGTP
jgi:hypothetical protein